MKMMGEGVPWGEPCQHQTVWFGFKENPPKTEELEAEVETGIRWVHGEGGGSRQPQKTLEGQQAALGGTHLSFP